MNKRTIIAIASLMAIGEFLAVGLYLLSNEHDLALSLLMGIPAGLMMFLVIGVLLAIVFYNRGHHNP
jgi:hypothetical protein